MSRHPLLAALLLGAGLILSPLPAPGQEAAPPTLDNVLEVAYSSRMFYGVDLKDAWAASQVWSQMLVQRMGEKVPAKTLIVEDLQDLVKGLNARQIDLILVLPVEYLQIRDRTDIVPALIGANGDDPFYHRFDAERLQGVIGLYREYEDLKAKRKDRK